MNSRRRLAACGLAVSTLLTIALNGCSQGDPVASEPRPPTQAETKLVDVSLVDRTEFDVVLAEHKGEVVLVDCWATWCLPCVEQLPHSAELAQQHRDAGLAVVTLSFDDPESSEQVQNVLTVAGAGSAGVTNLLSRFGSSSESLDAFEITSGALPHYKLYDRTGKLRHTFELDPSAAKQFTPADVDAAVAKLLAEQ